MTTKIVNKRLVLDCPSKRQYWSNEFCPDCSRDMECFVKTYELIDEALERAADRDAPEVA